MIKINLHTCMILAVSCFLFLFVSCDDPANTAQPGKKPLVVSGKVPASGKDSQAPAAPKSQSTVKPPATETDEKKDTAVEEEQKIDEVLEAKRYNAAGKIDPFAPLVKETVEEEAVIPDDRVLTPLEKIDLSQIKLVAIIAREDSSFAMVEEASGKGYEINVGTYIGRHAGKVFKIQEDRVIIKETVRNFKGEKTERYHELKLNKQDNGE